MKVKVKVKERTKERKRGRNKETREWGGGEEEMGVWRQGRWRWVGLAGCVM